MTFAPASFPALDAEADDAALAFRQIFRHVGMVRMAGQTGIIDPGDSGMLLEELRDSQRILRMAFQSKMQRLQAQ